MNMNMVYVQLRNEIKIGIIGPRDVKGNFVLNVVLNDVLAPDIFKHSKVVFFLYSMIRLKSEIKKWKMHREIKMNK